MEQVSQVRGRLVCRGDSEQHRSRVM
jgi:hypothetical protein